MDAIILAGGKGTRLSGVVSEVPKPLALVGARPFLAYIVDFLKASGEVEHIIVSAGHKAEQIENWARQSMGIKVTVVAEKEPLGTGGALLRAFDQAATTNTVIALNGDSLIRLDISAFLESHKESGCAVTMAITKAMDVSRSGEVIVAGDRIVDFHEKSGAKRFGWINAGIYLMNKTALENFPRGFSSLECQILPRLLKAGVHAYRADGAFVDIGTPEDYAAAPAILGVV